MVLEVDVVALAITALPALGLALWKRVR